MEPKNHPFENKNHLPSTSTMVFHLNLPVCSTQASQPWTWRAHQIVQIHHQNFIWLKTSWCPKGTLQYLWSLSSPTPRFFKRNTSLLSNFQWSTTLSSLPERYQKRLPGVRNVDPSRLHKYHWQILGDFRQTITLPKTNIAPIGISFSRGLFSGAMLVLGRVTLLRHNVETHQEQRFWKEWLIFEIDNDSKTTQLLLMGVDPAWVQLSWNMNSDVFFFQRSLAYFFCPLGTREFLPIHIILWKVRTSSFPNSHVIN